MSKEQADIDAEARYQAQLLDQIRSAHPSGQQHEATPALSSWRDQGLAAYQRHARATARAVLRQTFPTVLALIGPDALDALALRLWRSDPPRSGDLADWGEGLPACLAAQAELDAWPWLADCARLDWARHRCERAPDQQCDTASLARLSDTPAEQLSLHLQAHVVLLDSPWPLAALYEAQQSSSDEASARALATALAETQQRPSGPTLVWRSGWRAEVMALPHEMGPWMKALLAPTTPDLAQALDTVAANELNLADWLAMALERNWIWRVNLVPPSA
jgi:hypothetical protein